MMQKPQFDYVEVDTKGDNYHYDTTATDAEGVFEFDRSDATAAVAVGTTEESLLLTRWKRIVIFFGIILPILGMFQCHGWNEGFGAKNMKCYVLNGPLGRGYADFWYGFVLVGAFSGGILFLLYGLCLYGMTKFGYCIIRRSHFSSSPSPRV
jgi:hypothetical protein